MCNRYDCIQTSDDITVHTFCYVQVYFAFGVCRKFPWASFCVNVDFILNASGRIRMVQLYTAPESFSHSKDVVLNF